MNHATEGKADLVAANQWEVEQKYRVLNHDEIQRRLEHLSAIWIRNESHVDTYFRHPSRDFRQTDEALRIRSVNNETVVTYKGPRMPGPVKTRPEIELPLVSGTRDHWQKIWLALGFTIAASVAKNRQVYELEKDGWVFTIALDSVDQIGSFVEVETLVTDLDLRQVAQERIQQLASALGVSQVEPRSYLGLYLDSQASKS